MKQMKNLELSVIATYDGFDQDWFMIEAIPEVALTTETTLIDFVKGHLISPINALRKLSISWSYKNKNTYNAQKRRFPVIQQSVRQNGKYFFNKGVRDEPTLSPMFDDAFYDFLESQGVGKIDCDHRQWDRVLDLRNQVADFIEENRYA